MSPLIRVLAPIRVSIFAFLICFCLNIGIPLALDRSCPAFLGFDRHSLRLPNEGLAEAMTRILVFYAPNLYSDARRVESLRQLNGFVIILKVAERVCQAVAPVRSDLLKSQARGLLLQQSVDGDRGAARHGAVRLSSLHQHEFQAVLARGALGHNLHLLYLHVNDRVRLPQSAVERQVLVQPRDLALHIAQSSVDLLVALTIDAPPHFRRFELAALLFILRFELADTRAR